MKRLIILVLILLAGALACSVGGDEPPGEGPKAEEGYRLSQPIIDALGQYHEAQGEYPGSLDDLVPDYFTALPTGSLIQELWYTQVDESYQLSFAYTGPCMNVCNYTPEEGWKCSGAC
jgi:hypothetical protein